MSAFVIALSKHTAATVRLVLVAFLASWPAASRAQVVYAITDLGTIGSGFNPPNSAGRGINASGQVAGYSTATSPAVRAFRTTSTGRASDPGADLGVLPSGGWTDSLGFAINSSGQVTGYCVSGFSLTAARAFRTTATGRVSDAGTDLGALSGLPDSYGFAINATGQVTGYSTLHSGLTDQTSHAFRTTATGTLTDPAADLGVFSGGLHSYGYGINDAGQVAGHSDNAAGLVHAFRTSPTGRVTDAGADLGTLGGSRSQAFAINNAGQVTGSSQLAGDVVTHAFRSSPNGQPVSLTDLGALGTSSVGMGINSSGMVVGNYRDPLANPRAFVYDTQMRDLTSLLASGSGWVLEYAYGINDSGQITGIGIIGGQEHAFRLTPSPVPEPGGLILAGGAAAIWGWRRRK